MKTNLLDRITIESGKCGGRPCIRGMRIRANDILEMPGDGVDMSEILADFPDLERDDILACNLRRADRISSGLPREILGRRPTPAVAGGMAIRAI